MNCDVLFFKSLTGFYFFCSPLLLLYCDIRRDGKHVYFYFIFVLESGMCMHMDVSLCTHMQRPQEDIIVCCVLVHSALYFETVFQPGAHSLGEDGCPPRPRDPPISGCLSLLTCLCTCVLGS